MRLDPAGRPFIGGALLMAIVSAAAVAWVLAAPAAGYAAAFLFLVLAAFFVFFFRDPERTAPPGDHVVVSPADGRVLVSGRALAGAPPGSWAQISIFLSPMDVHVNRIPASGRITRVAYEPGRFLPAYRDDAGSANERSEIWIDHDGRTIVARQIVGILARRVVCRAQTGDRVRAGDRYGIMKFGSRMDIFLPADAEIKVEVGQTVRGGETVIAVLH